MSMHFRYQMLQLSDKPAVISREYSNKSHLYIILKEYMRLWIIKKKESTNFTPFFEIKAKLHSIKKIN